STLPFERARLLPYWATGCNGRSRSNAAGGHGPHVRRAHATSILLMVGSVITSMTAGRASHLAACVGACPPRAKPSARTWQRETKERAFSPDRPDHPARPGRQLLAPRSTGHAVFSSMLQFQCPWARRLVASSFPAMSRIAMPVVHAHSGSGDVFLRPRPRPQRTNALAPGLRRIRVERVVRDCPSEERTARARFYR